MVQQRSIAMAIILTIVTCGIYGIIWFIQITDDVNTLSRDTTTSGGKAFLFSLITCGIYSYFWAYRNGERLDALKVQQGLQTSSLAILYLILQICGLGIVVYALIQDELNKYAGSSGAAL